MEQYTTEDGRVIEVSYHHHFEWKAMPGAGFMFEVTPEGKYIHKNPEASANYEMCMSDDDTKLTDQGIQKLEREVGRVCQCGSGNLRYPLYDAQAIFARYVCESCEEDVRDEYEPWVFDGYNQAFLDEYSGERIEDDY